MTQASHSLACNNSAQISGRRRTQWPCVLCYPSPLLGRPTSLITVTAYSVNSFSPRHYLCGESQLRHILQLCPGTVCVQPTIFQNPRYHRHYHCRFTSSLDRQCSAYVRCGTPECSCSLAVPADTGNSSGEGRCLSLGSRFYNQLRDKCRQVLPPADEPPKITGDPPVSKCSTPASIGRSPQLLRQGGHVYYIIRYRCSLCSPQTYNNNNNNNNNNNIYHYHYRSYNN